MGKTVKNAYRMFKRGNGKYYIQNNETGEQRSLGTSDKAVAQRLFDAENQARETPALNLQLGRVYLSNADPKMATRTWEEVMNEFCARGKDSTRERRVRALKAPQFNILRKKKLIETTGEDFRIVLKRGGHITNCFLRCLHNLALGNGWIPCHVIPPKQWEKCTFKPKRAITLSEHQAILAAEQNIERRHYYQMLWFTGSAQTDCSLLQAGNFDLENQILSYQRKKTGEWSHLKIGESLKELLSELPREGYLFPNIVKMKDKDRAAEFRRRCRLLKIEGISLHSYRYAWAQRAFKAGYAERFAQAALGHSSSAVHHAYARMAKVVCPPLEDHESNIIPIPAQHNEVNSESAGELAG